LRGEAELEIKRYVNPYEYYELTRDCLYKKEVENNLLIGILEGNKNNKDAGDILFYSVTDNFTPVLLAMRTPPFDMLLYSEDANAQAQELLISEILEKNLSIPGILAEENTAMIFKSIWESKSNTSLKLFRKERVHKLEKCNEIDISDGEMRKAAEQDIDLLTKWNAAFHKDINESISDEQARNMISSMLGQIYIWVDKEIVSVCSSARETMQSRIINLVYTPPENRGKGYASSLVKTCCSRILDSEKKFCGLFTDLSNPTSNSIYKKIGFEPVMDFLHFKIPG
jgi:uncharacterized protein